MDTPNSPHKSDNPFSQAEFDLDCNSGADPYGVSASELMFLNRLASQMTIARLQAGHDPEDVLLSVWDLYEHSVRALVDGAYPGEKGSGRSAADVEELLEKLDDADEQILVQGYTLQEQERYIKQLEAICAPSKLAKLKTENKN